MNHRSTTPHQHLLRGLGLPALLLAIAISIMPVATASAHAARNAPRGMEAAAACALPLVRDHYVGFHIGVPDGWTLSTFNGAIALSRDTSGSEAAMLYPALLTAGLTPARFMAAAEKTIGQIAAAIGITLAFRPLSPAGHLPRAAVSGRHGSASVRGQAGILLVPDHTALAAQQVVFYVFWTPSARYAADHASLSGIAPCYGPEPGTLFRLYQDQVFAFSLPLGWQVTNEGQDSIDLVGEAQQAWASYLLTLLPPGSGVTGPRSLLLYVCARAGIQIAHILSSTDGPAQPQQNGAVQQQEIVEFTGTYAGRAVHGLVAVLSDVGTADTTGVLRLGMATVGTWNAVNSGLIRLMTSIQHNDAQDQAQWAHLTQQMEQNDQQTQQFDNVLRGVQDVQDPATGTVYEAPYDSYDLNGPDGPGYYIDKSGTLVKLTPVNHQ